MRVEVGDLNVKVEGDLTEEHPMHFNKIHVIYEFKGKDLPLDKLQKAVNLSEERYCGVSAVYSKSMEMTSEIRVVNEEKIWLSQSTITYNSMILIFLKYTLSL